MDSPKDPKKISRRYFLRGSALTLATGSILAACQPKIAGTDKTAELAAAGTQAPTGAQATTVTSELIPQAYLNPQDYDYRQKTTDFKTLFSPLKIGPLNLTHRMVKSAAGSAAYLGGLTDELLQYYVNFAKGGVELIWVEMVGALEPPADGSETPAETTNFARKLVEECGKYGAKLGYQHYGFSMKPSNELTKEDIAAEQARWVAIAQFLQKAGFVGIEINALVSTSVRASFRVSTTPARMSTALAAWKTGRAL
jgi:hypothetical protein